MTRLPKKWARQRRRPPRYLAAPPPASPVRFHPSLKRASEFVAPHETSSRPAA